MCNSVWEGMVECTVGTNSSSNCSVMEENPTHMELGCATVNSDGHALEESLSDGSYFLVVGHVCTVVASVFATR